MASALPGAADAANDDDRHRHGLVVIHDDDDPTDAGSPRPVQLRADRAAQHFSPIRRGGSPIRPPPHFMALTKNLPFAPSVVEGVFKTGIVGNTFAMAIAITVGQVTTSAPAAFAFARLRFPVRDVVFLVFLAGLIVPLEVRMVPIYLLVSSPGWIPTRA